jgi:hypothetical protein
MGLPKTWTWRTLISHQKLRQTSANFYVIINAYIGSTSHVFTCGSPGKIELHHSGDATHTSPIAQVSASVQTLVQARRFDGHIAVKRLGDCIHPDRKF